MTVWLCVNFSECPFTASNVEALNQHLQESHKLLTYDTRRHSSSFDSDTGDLQSQVMSLPSPTLTSPDNTKSPGPHGNMAGMDGDPMRRIDSICSQLANRGGGTMGYHDGFQVKQEPLSPGGVRFPPDMSAPSSSHHFPPSASPSGGVGEAPHFSHGGSPTSTISNPSGMVSAGGGMGIPRSSTAQHLPPFPSSMSRSYSNPGMNDRNPDLYPGLGGSGGRKNTSPSGMDPGRKYHHHMPPHSASSPRGFLPPTNRRPSNSFGNGMGSLGPMGPMRHNSGSNGGAERVRSIADSTSNLIVVVVVAVAVVVVIAAGAVVAAAAKGVVVGVLVVVVVIVSVVAVGAVVVAVAEGGVVVIAAAVVVAVGVVVVA
ncbi:hypothetical protein ElyMa_007018500 [Elysia marginata]|uniref:C2H2-type domain-containing protein n=1 Tax=Elysia marginata TaxID=1093978 RepID=A0AAV4JTN9_9GAST|nr:hypothetical protein ElyMa_007018500 [Elysia marginata]